MTLFVLAFLGGMLTILSPCILPVLPFVFAGAGRDFLRGTLPLLVGMALSFAAMASLVTLGSAWVVQANQWGRIVAQLLLAAVGLSLLSVRFSEWITRPLTEAGARLSQSASGREPSVAVSLLLGVATGLIWAPCAGPVLGLVLTGANLHGPGLRTGALLLAYAAGAASSLALAVLAGNRVRLLLRRSLGAGDALRRVLGVAVLVGVAASALKLDSGVLARLSLPGTDALESRLLGQWRGAAGVPAAPGVVVAVAGAPAGDLAAAPPMPSFDGAVAWLNSPPLTAQQLRGKTVLIDFWTYSCINCLRTLPWVRAWSQRYHDDGLVVVGIHTPEFAFEKDLDNVRKAVRELGVDYPVAIDNDWTLWHAFANEYWPAHYLVDAEGRIRYRHFGEGDYDETERAIRQLLAESGGAALPAGLAEVHGEGALAAPERTHLGSPETWFGYARARGFASPGGIVEDAEHDYALAAQPQLNDWSLGGRWEIGKHEARLARAGGVLDFRFHARDFHLVMGGSAAPVRVRVSVDGRAPGGDHGADIDADGNGRVDAHRLYQLLRMGGDVGDHDVRIEFLDPAVQVYAVTFG